MSREESIKYQNDKAYFEQRDLYITKIKNLNNRILNNKFKLNLLLSILSILMIIILISITNDIAYHKKKFNFKNKNKNKNINELVKILYDSDTDLYDSIGFSLLNFHIIYNDTIFVENFSFCGIGDCRQKSYQNFNISNFDVNEKELGKNICTIFDFFKISGYIVN
jgi:hypothetical protein